MLVEAEKSVLQAYSYFGDDSFVVGLCGFNITRTQIKIILDELKVEEVIVGFDRDYEEADSFEATSYYQKIISLLFVAEFINHTYFPAAFAHYLILLFINDSICNKCLSKSFFDFTYSPILKLSFLIKTFTVSILTQIFLMVNINYEKILF